jgi:outer membrane protein assembly factor BamB
MLSPNADDPRLSRPRTLAAIMLTLAGLAVVPAGCNRPTRTGPQAPADVDSRRAAFPLSDEDFSKIGYARDWLGFPVVAPQGNIIGLHAWDDLVIIQDSNSTATALENSTGQRRWSNQLASQLTRFVGAERTDGRLLAFAESEAIGLSPDTGDILMRQRFDRLVNTQGVLVGDRVIFGTARGDVLAHGLGLGFQAWAFGTGATITRSPVLIGGSVAILNDRGEVFFLNPVSGALNGRSQAMYASSAFDPVAAGDLLVVASLDQSLYAFRESGGRPVWQHRTSSPPGAAPSYFGGRVFCEVDGSLTGFVAGTGKVAWTSKGTKGQVVAVRQSGAGAMLLVQDGTNLSLVDAERGDVLERISVPGLYQVKTNGGAGLRADGTVYLISTSGLVAKLRPR